MDLSIPPVVTPEYELIAGERRVRALKLLDYKQTEVRAMAVNDAEHQLNIEISENEVRKDFSKSERVEYGRRLERIERIKVDERRKANLKQNTGVENFPPRNEGKTRDKIAEQIGIGSGKQCEKEKFIDENADPETLTQWNAGDISTYATYIKIKKEKELAE
jgi:ParB family chromosome partitioning protein